MDMMERKRKRKGRYAPPLAGEAAPEARRLAEEPLAVDWIGRKKDRGVVDWTERGRKRKARDKVWPVGWGRLVVS
jgi:hypothetical protein